MTPPKKESPEFWIGLGQQIGQNLECTQGLRKDLEKFMTNDHAHLAADVKELEGKLDIFTKDFQEKLGKVAIRIAYIVGGISALSFAIQIAARLLK
jgi:hypothetical protein